MSSSTTSTPAGAPTAGAPASSAGAGTLLMADDGRQLAASWFEPQHGPARAVALVSPATGAPRGFYRAFAMWLTERGYAVLTYDYRGIGGSRRGALRQEPATMRDWAGLDMSAALAAAEARRATQGLPLLLVGHSFGGNAIAFARGVERADALLAVGSQLGVPVYYPGVHRWLAHLFFRGIVPATVPLVGYLPGWTMGGSAPLPAGVARQWAHWGRMKGWAYDDPAMREHRAASALAVPVHLWDVSDDLTFAPARAVDALAEQFRNAAVQRHTLRPADVGQVRLGHFGVFRREPGPRAWAPMLDRLEAATLTLRPR